MRRRILVAILTVSSIAVVLFGVPLAIVVERFVDESAILRVEREAVLAARAVPGDFATSGDPVELPDGIDGIAIGLYGRDGRRVTGSGPTAADTTTARALEDEVNDSETNGLRVVAVPVSADEQVVGAIRAQQSTAASEARTGRIIALLAALGTGVLTIGAAIGWVVAGRLARPVRRLSDAAVRLGDGDFAIDVPRSRVPELDQAAVAMTATARRLDELLRRERSFSADASHQLRTPLAGLRATIETELEFPRPDHDAVLREALDDIDRLERTTTELLTLSRTRSTTSTVSLAAVLDDIRDAWHGRFASTGRPLVIVDAHEAPPVRGTGAMLRHALDVLLDNALVHGAGTVYIDHEVGSETVTVSLTDEGPGFAPGARSNGTDGDGNGSHGLGLPLARRLVEAMPGRLAVVRPCPRPRIDVVLTRTERASVKA